MLMHRNFDQQRRQQPRLHLMTVDKAKRLAVAELEGDIPAADNAAAAAELGDKPACSPGCDDNVGNDDGFGPCKCAELGKPCCE